MTGEQPHMRRDALLRRALVPKGYRPTKPADIDKLLDMVGDEPMTDEQKERMLRKINGQAPMFPDRSAPSAPLLTTELTETERELAAMYKAQNKPLPPDLAAKVKAMEQRASKRPNSAEGASGG